MFRTNAERSMGIYYPEEEEDKDKRAVPFQENAVRIFFDLVGNC